MADAGVALKRAAAFRAVDEFVESDSVVGLGTGTTACFVADRIAEHLARGRLKNITVIPTSESSREKAVAVGLKFHSPGATPSAAEGAKVAAGSAAGVAASLHPHVDCAVAIDGADEVRDDFSVLKGRGGALVREKIVEASADRFIIVCDGSKLIGVRGLGCTGAVPIEVVPFGVASTLRLLQRAVPRCAKIALREAAPGKPFVSDNGNFIAHLDLQEPWCDDPAAVATAIEAVPGVVGHGLFVGMAQAVVVAHAPDHVEVRRK